MVIIPDCDEAHLSNLEVESDRETDLIPAAIQFEVRTTMNKRRQLLLSSKVSNSEVSVVSNKPPLIISDLLQERLVMTYD